MISDKYPIYVKKHSLPLDKALKQWYNTNKLIHQTVEAEITAFMLTQRACVAESQVENRASNGPLRVQSKVNYLSPSILQRAAYVSCRGYAVSR